MRAYLKVDNQEIGQAIIKHMNKNGWEEGYSLGYYFVVYKNKLAYVNSMNNDWLEKNKYKEVSLSEFLNLKPQSKEELVGNYEIEVFDDKIEVADSSIIAIITYEEVKEIVGRMRC